MALREHIRYHEDNEQLKDSEADQKLRLDHWQYTKELAYQMFLQDTLDLVDSDDPNDSRPEAVGFRNAQNMTRKLRGDENLDLSPSKYQAVFPFSKDNGKGGIAFVHKTVYEYFTAVKLYEDYFAKFNSAFFRQYSPESKEATKAVRDSFIEAFRYKPVTSEIFAYLNDMSKPAFTGTGEDGADTFRFNLFANSFSAGMQQYFLCDFSVFERETAYTASCGWAEMPLSEQIKIAFCNLTWFLTKRENGFGNIDNIDACKEIAELISCRNKRAYLVGWNLSSIDLISTYLRNMYLNHANLANACLESSDLSGADLIGADLTSAELRDANMVGTDLTGACITGADLRNVNLSHADLAGADLIKADLSEANLTKADLSNAIFTDAHLNSAYLNETVMENASFKGANLSGASLNNAQSEYLDLRTANLSSAQIMNVYMRCANLTEAILLNAHLNGADLTSACLIRANLCGADLTNAHLSGADFTSAIMSGATLTGANLTCAKYCRVPGYETVFPDGFDPEEHNMIDVDERGNPIKKE